MPTKAASSHKGFDIASANVLLEELRGESDRGAALIGAAYLDFLMESLFESRMNQAKTLDTGDKKKKLTEKLLKYPGALSTAASRVDLAHGLGWIGQRMYADLVNIKHIRNKFAHSHGALRFNDREIGGLCESLHSLPVRGSYRLAGNRDKFLVGVCFLTMQITHLTASSQKADLGPDPQVGLIDKSTLGNQI